MADCSQNTDPLKLVREGTSQDDRAAGAPDPATAPVNARGVPYGIVFAQAYSRFLNYFDATNTAVDDWSAFFGNDVSVLLATASIEDIDSYKSSLRGWFDYLNDMQNQAQTAALKDKLGYLYSAVASLAAAFDSLVAGLPETIALKGTLQNLIRTQLAPAFARLIGYYKAGIDLTLVDVAVPSPPMLILRQPLATFSHVVHVGLSADWSNGIDWNTYVTNVPADASVYGTSPDVFTQINHCSTHNLFKSVFDQFLKVLVRTVGEAQSALDDTLTDWDQHEPSYALFLAFLELLEYARTASNALTQEHLDFYYRTILGLAEKPSQPGYAHLVAELAKQSTGRDFQPGELFKAGKDSQGKDAFFVGVRDVVANQAKVAALSSVYRHGNEPVNAGTLDAGRIYASPVANSADGLGAPLTNTDQSWQPFFNKAYTNGALSAIDMPQADIGFAIASHYLLAAEGARLFVFQLNLAGYSGGAGDFAPDVRCLLTSDKGWFEAQAVVFGPNGSQSLYLQIQLTGTDPAVVPYSPKLHGYNFDTDLPILLVKLKQDDTRPYRYGAFQAATVKSVDITVEVGGLKTLSVSNDFGPVDTSKPFQPFGASPVAGSSLIIGATEVFEKTLSGAEIGITWQIPPAMFPSGATLPNVAIQFLSAGSWADTSNSKVAVGATGFGFGSDLDLTVIDAPDFGGNASYTTQSRRGFLKLVLDGGFGQDAYQTNLIKFLKSMAGATDPTGTKPPTGPTAASLTVSYTAQTTLALNSGLQASFDGRAGQFFHLGPFGTAERHPYLSGGAPVPLFPQFSFTRDNAVQQSEAEFYIGISGLVPPQTLSLLFQVVDGTANPLAAKPVPHIDWSYLADNIWTEFEATAVQDATGELLNSGIVTIAMPRDATSDNTLMPPGLTWIRAAVQSMSDAVCNLQLVAAQALEVVFSDQGNAPDFSATPLPAGTIGKLATPDTAVKSVSQPYPGFGGRGAEQPKDFYIRVSERLRHKDRGIALWDYERLVLEAFPQIYKVKCLNHTCYEPNDTGTGIYRELAPGHVTIITVPNIQTQQQRDPLKPYTSLGVLQQVETFLQARTSCFAQLHVKNPQFEEVRVRFAMRLFPGYDEAYYTAQLQQAITRFLSPWAFAGGGSPTFNGTVYKSVLINFVEQQPYVDYVTDFQVFQDINGIAGTVDLDEVVGSKAVSILVSAPAGKHAITIIDEADDVEAAEACGCDA